MNRFDLREEIRQFQKKKTRFAIPILVLGVLGLILPVIPGVALIMLAILLLFPMQGQRLIDRIKRYVKKIMNNGESKQA